MDTARELSALDSLCLERLHLLLHDGTYIGIDDQTR